MEKIMCRAVWFVDSPSAIQNPINIDKGVVLCGVGIGQIFNQMCAITERFPGTFGRSRWGFLTNRNRFLTENEVKKIKLT